MGSRRLKVYGWTGHRFECPPAPNGSHQTREIVAASSVAEVMRLSGRRRSGLFNICETGNDEEIATAMAEPGVVFWRGINDWRGPWTRTEPTP